MGKKLISLLFSEKEVKLIKALCIYEPYLADNIRRSKKEGNSYQISFDGDDFIELLGAVSFGAEAGAPWHEPEDYHELNQRLEACQGFVADIYAANRKKGEEMLRNLDDDPEEWERS